MKIAEAFVEIHPRPSQDFDNEMQQHVGPKLESAAGKLSNVGKKLTAFATLPIAAGFAAATNAASDLNESLNVTGLVFGDARGEIDAFVKTTASGLGQSERAARDATATFGGLLKNLGLATDDTVDWSIKLTKLASDLGSAFNAEPAEAVEALGSALRGETEPIRRFNVMLDDATVRQKAVEMGLAASTAEVDKAGKAQATLALITEQTNVVQNDFANTSDGLANQQRILKARLEDTAAQLGTKLLPIALKAASGVLGMVDAFAKLDPVTQTAILGLAGVVAAIGPMTAAVGSVKRALDGLQKIVVALATSTSALTITTTPLVATLAAAGVAAYAYTRVLAGFRDIQEELRSKMVESTNTLALQAEMSDTSAKAMRDAAVEAYIQGAALRGMSSDADSAAQSSAQLAEDVEQARQVLVNLAESTGVSKERIAQLATEMGVNLAGATQKQREELAAALTTIGRAVTPTEKLAETEKVLGNEFATAAEKVDAFKKALDAALNVVLDADEATIRYRQKVLDLAQAFAAGAEKGEGFQEFNDRMRLGLIEVVKAAEDEVKALTESGKISTDAATQKQALIDRLNHLKEVFPQLRAEIDKYIYGIASIPEEKVTKVTVVVEDPYGAADPSGGFPAGTNLKAPRRARGGSTRAGGLYWVGEEGPELWRADGDGTVIPAAQSASAAGASVHVDAHFEGWAPEEALELFRRDLRNDLATMRRT